MEIRNLNSLRGLAALIVLISHFSNSTNWLGGILGHGAGHHGVMLFFILSGFLMSYLYLRQEPHQLAIKKYLLARVARVMPLFLLVVIASYLLFAMGVEDILYSIDSIQYLAAHLLMVKGENVLWTIGPEVQFYFAFVGIWLLFRHYLLPLLIALTLVCALWFYLSPSTPFGIMAGIPYQLLIVRSLPYFLIGVIIGRLYLQHGVCGRLARNRYALVLMLIPLLFPQVFTALFGLVHDQWRDPMLFLAYALIFSVIVFLVPQDNLLLANKVGDYLGKISYSVYLLHQPILWHIETLSIDSNLTKLGLFLASTIFVSHLSYHFIERPSAKLIRRVA